MKIDQHVNDSEIIDSNFIFRHLKKYSKYNKYPTGPDKKRMEISILYIKDKISQVSDTISKMRNKVSKIENDNNNMRMKCDSLVMKLRENLG